MGGARPRTAHGEWGSRIWPWGSVGVRWGHPAAAQGGGGCSPCTWDKGGQLHGLYPSSRTALLPQPPYGVLLSPSPQEGGGGHILPRMGGLPVAWGPGVPPEPGGSAQLPSPPAQALPSALTRELLCLPARVGAQPCRTPQPARGCTAAPPGTGTAGAAEGVPVKGGPVSPPLPLLAPLHPARMPPLGSAAPPRPGH